MLKHTLGIDIDQYPSPQPYTTTGQKREGWGIIAGFASLAIAFSVAALFKDSQKSPETDSNQTNNVEFHSPNASVN